MGRKSAKVKLILFTLSFLVFAMTSRAGIASASSTYSVTNVPTVGAGMQTTVGALRIDLSAGVAVGDYVYMSLPASPAGYSFNNVAFSLPATVNGSANAIAAVSAEPVDQTGQVVKITVTGLSLDGSLGQIVVGSSQLDQQISPSGAGSVKAPNFTGLNIAIPFGAAGDIKVTMSAPAYSAFSNGAVTIARMGTPSVTVGINSPVAITSAGGILDEIYLKENIAGALYPGYNSVKLTLPPGFSWNGGVEVGVYWGNINIGNQPFNIFNNGRTLAINLPAPSTSAAKLRINAGLSVNESIAQGGDVVCQVDGDSIVTPSTLTVARYTAPSNIPNASISVSAGTPGTVIAGKTSQRISEMTISESAPGQLPVGRTITLTLPDKANWDASPIISTASTLNGLAIAPWTFVGSTGQTIKTVVTNASVLPATLVLRNGTVNLAADYSGDLSVTVGGDAGAAGVVTVAQVTAPVTATVVGTPPQLQSGVQGQSLPDIIITENLRGAISSDIFLSYISLEFPPGVYPSIPSVQVTQGDLEIDSTSIQRIFYVDHWGVSLRVISSSTLASTLRFSNLKVDIQNNVAAGHLQVLVKGNSVAETSISQQLPYPYQPFDYSASAAGVIAGNISITGGNPALRLVFTVNPGTLAAGTRDMYTAQVRDLNNNLQSLGAETTFNLLSTSQSGRFYNVPSGGTPIQQINESALSNQITFYYEDTAAGGHYNLLVFSPALTAWTTVTVGSSGSNGTVSGSVQLQGPSDYSNVKVFLINSSTSQTVAQTVTGSSGGYQFMNVPPGNYKVVVQHPGYLKSEGSAVTVTTGQGVSAAGLTMSAGDLNGDNKIDLSDLVIFGRNFGKTY